ncbi:5-oxoprolinase subunit PxpB [Hymenobacter sp. CRA2]|uniref:5-oxoprolinase subunit PxpB n=1 Tax=Hymenobacter sp. CRA2 TaxID=1955620 RepID=UPI00098ED299|nr:5-oxoprolinase subunit PxpB [Hymenobacter sp. CRA2]OON69542.1 kinase inhibitor [Hymenobacter sp. CRA2]
MLPPFAAPVLPAPWRLYPLGDAAVVLECGDVISPETHARIQALDAALEAYPLPGLVEYVPAFTTLTVFFDPWLLYQAGYPDPYAAVVEHVQQLLLPELAPLATQHAAPPVEVPVCYGGKFGPDLDEVARHTGLSPAEVISLHAAPDYLVYMIGFAPGFPYLGGLDTRLATPRKAQPRPLVPAGSVGIAGPQTGIYSLPTPGGWQLIGRTPLRLFRPGDAEPSLLHAGQRLRFVPISAAEFDQLATP